MSFNKENIVWVDVETSGLSVKNSYLLEIAVLITDHELNILDETGFHAVVQYDDESVKAMRAKAAPVVQQMHDKTGLWDLCRGDAAKPLEKIDAELHAYLQRWGDPRTMPVAGNSVRLDLNFIEEFMPRTYSYLDYHMRDVSTVAGFVRDWYDLPWYDKANDHTAMTDIRESIKELQHYREVVFRTREGANLTSLLRGDDAGWVSVEEARRLSTPGGVPVSETPTQPATPNK